MAKETCDRTRKISIGFLKKNGYLFINPQSGVIKWFWNNEPSGSAGIESHSCEDYIRFTYTKTYHDGKTEDFDYKVSLTFTRCFFGGYRYWFVCPLICNGVPCGKRVGVLYLTGKYFGCRSCHRLLYDSQYQYRSPKFKYFVEYLKKDELNEKEANLRIKYWYGLPTKKYMKLLNKLGKDPPQKKHNLRLIDEYIKNYHSSLEESEKNDYYGNATQS